MIRTSCSIRTFESKQRRPTEEVRAMDRKLHMHSSWGSTSHRARDVSTLLVLMSSHLALEASLMGGMRELPVSQLTGVQMR